VTDPPDYVRLSLEETLALLSAMEDARDLFTRLVEHAPLRVVDVMGPLVGVEYQMGLLRSRLGIGGDPDDA
jgi:hypothetical protein